MATISQQRETIPIAEPAVTTRFFLAGHPYLLTVWSESCWARLPHHLRPAEARELPGIGWFEIRPDRS